MLIRTESSQSQVPHSLQIAMPGLHGNVMQIETLAA